MEDVERPAHVQRLPQPAWHRRARVQVQPRRLVMGSESLHGIARYLRRTRDGGQEPSVRIAKLELALGQSRDPVTLLVDRPVVPPGTAARGSIAW